MRFMVNARLAEGVSRSEFIDRFEEHGVSPEGWELYRQGVINEYPFKVGEVPGFVLFLDSDSLDDVHSLLEELPVGKSGLLEFEIDPVSPLATFDE
jgi:hypothetical protein